MVVRVERSLITKANQQKLLNYAAKAQHKTEYFGKGLIY